MTMPINVIQPSEYTDSGNTLPRIVWAPVIEDLHVNLVNLTSGQEIGTHTNQSLDVLLTCMNGSGDLTLDGEVVPLHPGTIAVIPKGISRRIVASSEGLQYTTCHRKRGGIMPSTPRIF